MHRKITETKFRCEKDGLFLQNKNKIITTVYIYLKWHCQRSQVILEHNE